MFIVENNIKFTPPQKEKIPKILVPRNIHSQYCDVYLSEYFLCKI